MCVKQNSEESEDSFLREMLKIFWSKLKEIWKDWEFLQEVMQSSNIEDYGFVFLKNVAPKETYFIPLICVKYVWDMIVPIILHKWYALIPNGYN